MSSEDKPDVVETLNDILDQMLADPTVPDEPGIMVSLPLNGPGDEEDQVIEQLEQFFAQGERDLEVSVRQAMREEMDNVAESRYTTPHKLDVARQRLHELSLEAHEPPDEWLARLEARHPHVGPVLPVVDGEVRLELTDYPTLSRAAAVIPATVSDRGLVILFKGTELRARNGRRFHKRAWTDVLDEGIIGPVISPSGDMSAALRNALRFLPGYSRNLRRWGEI